MIPPVSQVSWDSTYRIISTRYPPIDLFEDIANPDDWADIISAEAKTNPRLVENIGNLAYVPNERRVAGPGASLVMAPFVHASTDRPNRFSDGSFGIYYAGDLYEVALYETIHHHACFMRATNQEAGWTSQFRELIGSIDKTLHDICANNDFHKCLDPNDYTFSQVLGKKLKHQESDGIVYESVRYQGGRCIAIFWPDVVSVPIQGRHLSYYWSGNAIEYVRDEGTGNVVNVTTP